MSHEEGPGAPDDVAEKKGSWAGRALSWPFRKAAQGAWWTAKLPFRAYAAGVAACWNNSETWKGKAMTAFGAAVTGVAAAGLVAGSLAYGGLYGTVAAGDYYWFGQPYKSSTVTGTIAELGSQGKFPCDTIEGKLALPNIGKNGSSTFEFSVRRGFPEVIEKLEQAYKDKKPVDLDYDQSHWPTEWFDAEAEGWFIPGIDFGFECIQKTDINITGVRPSTGELPAPPKFQQGRDAVIAPLPN